jgi:hypothetical protein
VNIVGEFPGNDAELSYKLGVYFSDSFLGKKLFFVD